MATVARTTAGCCCDDSGGGGGAGSFIPDRTMFVARSWPAGADPLRFFTSVPAAVAAAAVFPWVSGPVSSSRRAAVWIFDGPYSLLGTMTWPANIDIIAASDGPWELPIPSAAGDASSVRLIGNITFAPIAGGDAIVKGMGLDLSGALTFDSSAKAPGLAEMVWSGKVGRYLVTGRPSAANQTDSVLIAGEVGTGPSVITGGGLAGNLGRVRVLLPGTRSRGDLTIVGGAVVVAEERATFDRFVSIFEASSLTAPGADFSLTSNPAVLVDGATLIAPDATFAGTVALATTIGTMNDTIADLRRASLATSLGFFALEANATVGQVTIKAKGATFDGGIQLFADAATVAWDGPEITINGLTCALQTFNGGFIQFDADHSKLGQFSIFHNGPGGAADINASWCEGRVIWGFNLNGVGTTTAKMHHTRTSGVNIGPGATVEGNCAQLDDVQQAITAIVDGATFTARDAKIAQGIQVLTSAIVDVSRSEIGAAASGFAVDVAPVGVATIATVRARGATLAAPVRLVADAGTSIDADFQGANHASGAGPGFAASTLGTGTVFLRAERATLSDLSVSHADPAGFASVEANNCSLRGNATFNANDLGTTEADVSDSRVGGVAIIVGTGATVQAMNVSPGVGNPAGRMSYQRANPGSIGTIARSSEVIAGFAPGAAVVAAAIVYGATPTPAGGLMADYPDGFYTVVASQLYTGVGVFSFPSFSARTGLGFTFNQAFFGVANTFDLVVLRNP